MAHLSDDEVNTLIEMFEWGLKHPNEYVIRRPKNRDGEQMHWQVMVSGVSARVWGVPIHSVAWDPVDVECTVRELCEERDERKADQVAKQIERANRRDDEPLDV